MQKAQQERGKYTLGTMFLPASKNPQWYAWVNWTQGGVWPEEGLKWGQYGNGVKVMVYSISDEWQNEFKWRCIFTVQGTIHTVVQ